MITCGRKSGCNQFVFRRDPAVTQRSTPNAVPPVAEAAGPPGQSPGMLTGAALLAATTVVVKLAAFAKDWLVAGRFGASDELDAFLIGGADPLVRGRRAGPFVGRGLHADLHPRVRNARWRRRPLGWSASLLAAGTALLVAVTLVLRWHGAIASCRGWAWASPTPKLELAESLFYVPRAS